MMVARSELDRNAQLWFGVGRGKCCWVELDRGLGKVLLHHQLQPFLGCGLNQRQDLPRPCIENFGLAFVPTFCLHATERSSQRHCIHESVLLPHEFPRLLQCLWSILLHYPVAHRIVLHGSTTQQGSKRGGLDTRRYQNVKTNYARIDKRRQKANSVSLVGG